LIWKEALNVENGGDSILKITFFKDMLPEVLRLFLKPKNCRRDLKSHRQ